MTHTKYLKKKNRKKIFLSRGNSHFCKKILHFLSSELKISGLRRFPTVEISIQPGDTINRATCERISVTNDDHLLFWQFLSGGSGRYFASSITEIEIFK